jgi:branched-subunit amino acid aminotransferase/4-amino-4-deoxychorismate lyase
VLLHTATHLLESVTSNIAIQMPQPDGSLIWVTPMLDKESLPFLDGVMRQQLLAEGIVQEGEVTLEHWHRAKEDGWRVIGFNGLR